MPETDNTESSEIKEFLPYHYIECKVSALPLIAANVATIVDALSQDVANRLLISLNIEWTAGATVPTISFRYMSETTDLVLTEGMYLVIVDATKRKKVMTAEEFVASYAEGDHTGGGDEPDPGPEPGEDPNDPTNPGETNTLVNHAVVGKATLLS